MNAVIGIYTKRPGISKEGAPPSAAENKGGGTGARSWAGATGTDVSGECQQPDLNYTYQLLPRSDMCEPILINLNLFATNV